MSEQQKTSYVLVGDIGGTNVRLQIVKVTEDKGQYKEEVCLEERTLTKDSIQLEDQLNQIIANFQTKQPGDQVTLCSLGVPAPVIAQSCPTGFLDVPHWDPSFSGKNLKEKTGIPYVVMINDFQANGYAVLDLKPEELRTLYSPKEEVKDNKMKLIYGLGTGLGVGYIARGQTDKNYMVYGSEYGIFKYNAYLPIHERLETFMDEHYYIDIKNGFGVQIVYEFLMQDLKLPSNIPKSDISPKTISHLAQTQKDLLCMKTLEFYFEYIALNLQELVCFCYPMGGIYLSSTVFQKNQHLFDDQEFNNRFIQAFQSHPILEGYLKKIPIYIVLEEDLAQRGCIKYLKIHEKL